MFFNRYGKYVFETLEVMVVILLVITVVLTGQEIAFTLWDHFRAGDLIENYKLILSEILLLAIGIEMAILIIRKNIYYVIDILILATARKLITYEQSSDLLISIICIVLLLGAKIYYNQKVLCDEPEEKS